MKRRMFLLFPALLAAKPAEVERIEVSKFSWPMSADKAPRLGATVRVHFLGQPHDVTVTRVDVCGDRAVVYGEVAP